MKKSSIKVKGRPLVDIESAFSRAVFRDVGTTTVPLASVEDMILMKEMSGRAQDLADIEHLRRLREGV